MQFIPPTRRSRAFTVRTAGTAAAAAALVFLCVRFVPELFGIVFRAALISFLLAPLCGLLERRLPRRVCALLAILLSAAALLALTGLLLPRLAAQLKTLADRLPEALQRLRSLAEALQQRLNRLLPGISLAAPSAPEMGAGGLADRVISTLSSTADVVYRLFLSVALSYFLLSDRERILLRLELLIPSGWRRHAVRAGNMLLRELRLYLRGQATIALAVGLLAAAGLLLIGVPGAPVLGVIVGVFNVIPYLGPLLGGIPAVLFALSIGWKKALLTTGMLFLVQQADGLVISPRVMGNITGFSPALVLVALYIGARICGIGGMLLALPALMTIRTLYRVFVQRSENN